MKGSHHVIIDTAHIRYTFDIKRNITVIQGESATGKTTLIEYLSMYARNAEKSGVRVESDVKCVVFNGSEDYWKGIIESIKNAIIFIDEDYSFIYSKEFAEVISKTDNYYVLITRKPLYYLPYSTKEIYGIRTSGRYHFPEKVYQEFYPLYDETSADSSENNAVLIVEDSNAGFEFFTKVCNETVCVSARGNSNVYSEILGQKEEVPLTIIADGAAFGAFIEKVYSLSRIRGNAMLYLPESFEWLVLKSGVVESKDIEDILEHTEDYVESKEFFSWERFYTHLLENETSDSRYMKYSKKKLSDYYYSESVSNRILDVLPEDVRKAIE